MTLNTVSGGNKIRWDGKKNPFYEIYYLKLVDPNQGWSFWARYTLLIPKGEREKGQASLWAIFSTLSSEAGSIALKKSYPLLSLDPFHSDHFIQLGDNFLSLGSAHGAVVDSDHHIQWDFQFEDPSQSACLYPHQFLYSFPLPKTKFLEPRVSTRISGRLVVDNQLFKLEGHPAHQAHIWGTEYAQRWVWGNCNGFEEDETAIFEGLTAEIAVGPFKSPPMSLFYFFFEGREYRANKMTQWFSNRSDYDLCEWRLMAVCGDMKFDGRVTRDVSQIIGVEYLGPRGERRYCHNTMMGTMELNIYKKEKKRWNLYKTLTAKKSCAFETVESKPDPRVKFVL